MRRPPSRVVESDAVQAQRGLSAADYIVGLAGVDNAQTGLVQANTVTRGFNNVFSGTLLTLVDNRITRVPSLRFNAHHFIPVTNHDIERVEVVLGPGSALYGPNSANGVMHIITRSPFGSEGTSVSVMGGERDLRKLSFRHAASTEKVGVKLSGQYFSGTDWEYTDPEEVRLRGRNPRDYDVSRISGELRLDVRPREDLTGILSAGFARINSIEMTGIGGGQADGWAITPSRVACFSRTYSFRPFTTAATPGIPNSCGQTRPSWTNPPLRFCRPSIALAWKTVT